ncbi:doublecortin domain-containing protein 2C isoform 2 [Daubentonia madagascariensis]|uniref:Doublecortin domain-containing protein 2C isoform 2 n=1 Tax=Daubentonia madagascariensis TaxID=31869 RepID=A0ABD2E4S8_DAUMA
MSVAPYYIHIVPRKPAKMRKLKEIKPVVHCDINVPSRWQTYNRISRHIKLFTMNGHLLDNSKDLQDNHFYVAVGLETFKHFPYWNSPRVPSEVQQRYADIEKYPPRKKMVDSKGKEPHKYDNMLPETQDSVYYAKEEKKTLVEPLVQRGAEGDVFKAQTANKETQGALDVKEDQDVQVEVPVDQIPAEIVKEDEEIYDGTPGFEGSKEKEDERLREDIERKMAREWKPIN